MCVRARVCGSPPDVLADALALGDEHVGVEACDDALEHLVDDGRKDFVVILRAQCPVNLGQPARVGAEEHTEADVDHL